MLTFLTLTALAILWSGIWYWAGYQFGSDEARREQVNRQGLEGVGGRQGVKGDYGSKD